MWKGNEAGCNAEAAFCETAPSLILGDIVSLKRKTEGWLDFSFLRETVDNFLTEKWLDSV